MKSGPMKFDAIPRTNLSFQVADTIRQRINSGEIAPEMKLPSERELSEAFSVSRVSIREAIQILLAQGYVEIQHGKGTFVLDAKTRNEASLQSWVAGRDEELNSMIEMRIVFEPGVAALAAKKAKPEDLERLMAIANSLHDCPRDELSQTDAEFHLMIATLTGNPLISELAQQCLLTTDKLRDRTLQGDHGRRLAADGHVKIAEAIASGDPDRARFAMLSHLEDARDSL